MLAIELHVGDRHPWRRNVDPRLTVPSTEHKPREELRWMDAGQNHTLTETGKGIDLSFLGKPHEHDPRRVYSTTAHGLAGPRRLRPPAKDRLAARAR